jgi:hypothetical protein
MHCKISKRMAEFPGLQKFLHLAIVFWSAGQSAHCGFFYEGRLLGVRTSRSYSLDRVLESDLAEGLRSKTFERSSE